MTRNIIEAPRCRITLSLLFLIFGVAPGASGQEAHALQLRLEEGATYRQSMTVESVTSMEIMGEPQETSTTQTITAAYAVREVMANGDMLIDVTHERIVMSMKSPMMNVEYDSDDPPDVVPMLAVGVAAMVDQTYTVHWAPDGTIRDASGLVRIIDEAMEPLDIPAEALEQVREQWSGEALGKVLESVTGHLPKEPVMIGETWGRSVSVSLGPIAGLLEASWTLMDVNDGVAYIRGTTTLGNGGEVTQELGQTSMRYALDGGQRSEMEVDVLTGWILQSVTEGGFGGSMSMDLPDGTEMTTPISVTTTLTLTTEPGG